MPPHPSGPHDLRYRRISNRDAHVVVGREIDRDSCLASGVGRGCYLVNDENVYPALQPAIDELREAARPG